MRVGKPGERCCLNCAHAYCEPDDDPVCGLPECGLFGKYLAIVRPNGFTCGEGLPKFEEHIIDEPKTPVVRNSTADGVKEPAQR